MSCQRLILVVDDDHRIRGVLRQGLEREDFMVEEAASKAEIFDKLRQHPVALITLDLGLGEVNGLALIQEIRSACNVPIVVVTGRAEPIDRVLGLEHGADDYVIKPFMVEEVILRVRALLRRYDNGTAPSSPMPDRLAFAGGVLDVRKRELHANDGKVIELTETELRLMELFLRHPARVLSRNEINKFLRGHEWLPLDRTIDGHIARLRRKIEPLSDEPKIIKSVRGIGYVFCS